MTQQSDDLMFKWDPAEYAANSSSQLAWARELKSRISPRPEDRLLDIGCGDGKVTAELSYAVPHGLVTGIDNSAEMITFAREHYPPSRHPNLEFLHMDARDIRIPEAYDLVFSNAALHWVDDHRAFLRGAAAALKPGGRLVISCGGHGNANDVFTAIRAEMRSPAWRSWFRNLRKPYFFYRAEQYRDWLEEAGFRAHTVRLAEKDAAHSGTEGFAGWIRTTWLPYTHRVPEARREEFIRGVVKRFVAKHPPDAAGLVHVRMVRLEIDAEKL